jgi:Kelch motif protein
MPGQSRNRFGIATVNARIYVVGGEMEEDRSVPFTVWRYEPDE